MKIPSSQKSKLNYYACSDEFYNAMVNNIVNNNPNMAASLQGIWRQKVCAIPPAPPALMINSFALPAPLQVLYISRVQCM